MTFYVHNDGRLTFTRVETNLFSVCLHNEVSVVANDRSNWILDPNPQKVNLCWRFWNMERNLIS